MTTSGRPVSGASRSSCSLRRRCSGMPWSWSSRKKRSLPEDVAGTRRRRCRASSQSSTSSALGDLAAEARRQADQALAVLREVLAVDARLVVVAVDVGVGDEPAQVPVAGHVRREQDQVEGLGVGLALLVAHRPPGDVGLDADDRLDARLASPPGRRRPSRRARRGRSRRGCRSRALTLVSTRSVIRPSPSSRLNSEWVWRWTKSFGAMRHGVSMVPAPGRRGRLAQSTDAGSAIDIDRASRRSGRAGPLAASLAPAVMRPIAASRAHRSRGSGPMDRDNEGTFRRAATRSSLGGSPSRRSTSAASVGRARRLARQRVRRAAQPTQRRPCAALRQRPDLQGVETGLVGQQPGRAGVASRSRSARSGRPPAWSRAPARRHPGRPRSGQRSVGDPPGAAATPGRGRRSGPCSRYDALAARRPRRRGRRPASSARPPASASSGTCSSGRR